MPHPSVVLATAGYDHTVRFWEATSGRCYKTLQYTDSVSNDSLFHPTRILGLEWLHREDVFVRKRLQKSGVAERL